MIYGDYHSHSNHGIQVVTQPTVEPLTLAEAKAQCRVEHDYEDDMISDWVVAARQQCEMFCRKSFTNKTFLLTMDGFNHHHQIIHLPYPPVIAVTLIQYIDINGTLQTLDSSLYAVDTISESPRLYPTYNNVWPDTQIIPNAVKITYTVGYSGAVIVPSTVKSAMKLLISHWYNNREAASPRMMTDIPQGVEALLWGNRTF